MKNTIIKELLKRPIAYQPIVAKAFDSVTTAILWCQLYYWSDKTINEEGWIYKTRNEIFDETGLSRKQQETARRIGEELGVIECKRMGEQRIVHFRIDEDRTLEMIESYLEKNNGQLPIKFEKKEKTTSTIDYLEKIPDEDMKEIMARYKVSEEFVAARADDVITYCKAKGKTYKDYRMALHNFIKSHLERHPYQRMKVLPVEEKKEWEKEVNRTPAEQARINNELAKVRQGLKEKLSMKI